MENETGEHGIRFIEHAIAPNLCDRLHCEGSSRKHAMEDRETRIHCGLWARCYCELRNIEHERAASSIDIMRAYLQIFDQHAARTRVSLRRSCERARECISDREIEGRGERRRNLRIRTTAEGYMCRNHSVKQEISARGGRSSIGLISTEKRRRIPRARPKHRA